MQAKLFTQTEDGIPIHWELDAENVGELILEVGSLIEYIGAQGMTAHHGFGSYARNGAVAAQEGAQPSQAKVAAVTCPNGHTEMYDNRASKKGQQPDWRCKTCRYGGWVKDNGQIDWKPPLPK